MYWAESPSTDLCTYSNVVCIILSPTGNQCSWLSKGDILLCSNGTLILQLQINLRNTIQKNIAIVQSWKDKSSNQIMTGVNINVRMFFINQLMDLHSWVSIIRHTHLIVENNTKVANRLWWKNVRVVKKVTDVTKPFQIVTRRSNKIFSLVLIQLKFVFNHPMLYVCHTPGELKKCTPPEILGLGVR